MKNWHAVRTSGGLFGLLAVLIFLGGAFYFSYTLWQNLGPPADPKIDFFTFLLGLSSISLVFLSVIVGYWTIGYFNLRYQLDRNGLVIVWAGVKQVIPMNMIAQILPWNELAETLEDKTIVLTPGRLPTIRGPINWPGYHIGGAEVKGVGPFIAYITHRTTNSLVVRTPTMNYLISPQNPANFLQEYSLRRNLGMTSVITQSTVRRSIVAATVWNDRTARWLLLFALLANILFFGYLCTRYSSFPSYIPFHRHEELTVDINGGESPSVVTDRIETKVWIFWLPIAGTVILFLNTIFGLLLHPREPLAARLLFGCAFAAQIVFCLASLGMAR